MVEMKVECDGLNSKLILCNSKLIVKHKLKLPFYNKSNCLTFSLNQIKLIEFSTKSIVPPIIYLLIFSFLVYVGIFYVKVLSNLLKTAVIIFLILGVMLNFILIIIRLKFGSLKIELNNGVFLKVAFVKKRKAEEFISKINY